MSDLISRQAALEILDDFEEDVESGNWGTAYSKARTSMCDLPSVEPERPRGKWIKAIDPDVNAWTGGHTCSECGRACVQMSMNYCANCGAPMEVHDGKENS